MAEALITRRGGSAITHWSNQYDGVTSEIKDVKGNSVNVKVGDYVYNERGSLKVVGSGGTSIDRTTPTQVINQAYSTVGNGGRKLVRLDDGTLVSAVNDTGNSTIKIYKSVDNGSNWTLIATKLYGTLQSFCIATDGDDTLYMLVSQNNLVGYSYTETISTLNGGDISGNFKNVFINQTAMGGCSLTVASNGDLHACCTSKNASYPNSFNILYSKSTDGGATWDAVTQLTNENLSTLNITGISIVMNGANPYIVYIQTQGSIHSHVRAKSWNGSTWDTRFIYTNNTTYVQSNPSADVLSDGTIIVAWQGKDATDSTQNNIRFSQSTNNGANWSAMEKLTSGDVNNMSRPSITRNSNDQVFIMYTDTVNEILYLIDGSSNLWGVPQSIKNNVSDSIFNATTCNQFRTFTKPLAIFEDADNSDVKFYGAWSTAPQQIFPPASTASTIADLTATVAGVLEFVSPVGSPLNIDYTSLNTPSNERFGVSTTLAEERAIDITPILEFSAIEVSFKLFKVGSPTDNVIVSLYSVDGGGAPDALIQEIGQLDGSTLSTSTAGELKTFSVTLSTPQPAGNYAILLDRSGALNSSNYYRAISDDAASGNPGSNWVYVNGAWSENTGRYLYVESALTVKPTRETGFISKEDLIS